jgi:putative SOS response-associated peptidase YedK
MCGRYVSVRGDADLLSEFDAMQIGDASYEPDYNVAPTKPVRIIVNRQLRDDTGQTMGEPVRQLRVATWGLVPSWAKDPSIGPRLINARSEGLATARAFRRAYAARRCLIPADGWYEWKAGAAASARKQPYYVTPSDGHVLAFAGVYEFWGRPGQLMTSASIITCDSTGELAEIHNRMPLVLSPDSWSHWLDPTVVDPVELLSAWDEASGEHLELRPVGPKVGDYRNNGPELIDLVRPDPEPQALF